VYRESRSRGNVTSMDVAKVTGLLQRRLQQKGSIGLEGLIEIGWSLVQFDDEVGDWYL
jgi:hypothetical protein